ncbi:hypothetical protein PR048_006146 [Dryococelus australis]|uniref:Maturase K n=1 Tax=Dryococelus australis TaxID=614101 RepID=A0ABQ9IA64_9NEOP|nr:hypothetical protein PR048_006146 [Dryococelus australis]
MHIKSFPRRVSHYSRNYSKRYYLSSELNVTKMYHLYLENMSLRRTKHSKRARKNSLSLKYRTIFIIGFFYDELKSKTALAHEKSDVDVLAFDYEQNLPLPKVRSAHHTSTYLTKLLEVNSLTKRYIFLQHYIDNVWDKNLKELFFFSDYCSAQNKNHVALQYMFSLVKTKPGLSFLPCDRSFGVIEKRLRFIGRIYLLGKYNGHIKSASKEFYTIQVEQNMILDFSDLLKAYFKKIVMNQHRQRFLVSRYRMFDYD